MNRRTLMIGGLAALLATTTACSRRGSYEQPYEAQAKQVEAQPAAPAQPPVEQPKAPEPPKPEIVTLEEISGNYTLSPNGKSQRASVSYSRWTEDDVEHASLNIDYFRPGFDEKKLAELSGEGYACVPAAQFSFESRPGEPDKIIRGTYELNGKDEKGNEICGNLIWWTTEEAERKEGTLVYTGKRVEDMQKLFEYTVKTVRAQKEQSERDAMSQYLAK